jgi:hypothetical protein
MTMIGIFTILISSFGFVKSEEWFLYESQEFSIRFPYQPKSETRINKTVLGEMKDTRITYHPDYTELDDNIEYGIGYFELNDSILTKIKTIPTFDIFRIAIDESVRNSDGQLLSERKIKLDGFPGREIKTKSKTGIATSKCRMYFVNKRMYMMLVITRKEKNLNNSINKFLNSFKLLK